MTDPPANPGDSDNSLSVAIDYARERYVEEMARFDFLEDKSSRFLGMLTIAIGGFSVLAGWYLEAVGKPQDLSDWFTMATLIVTFASLAYAWSYVLAALKLQTVDVATRSPEAIEHIKNSSSAVRDDFILSCYADTVQKIAKTLEEKERDLGRAFKGIVFSGVSFLVSITCIIINKWWLLSTSGGYYKWGLL